MPHYLDKKVHSVRRLARGLVVLYGVLWVLGAVAAAALAMGLADFFFRSEEHGVRLICSLVVFGAGGWTFYRFLYPGLRYRPGDVQIAERIERRYPELLDRLASAVQFLGQPEDDATAGSAALRRSVISEATVDVQRLDLRDVVSFRRTAWAGVVTCAVLLLVLVIGLLDAPSALLAARRLAMPWSSEKWPHVNHLVFIDPPTQIPVGDDLHLELIDKRGKLPRSVKVYYRLKGQDPADVEVREMTRDHLRDRMTDDLRRVTGPLEYRAVGGDDDTMPWRALKVIQPPRITSLAVRLHPPAYTGWPVEKAEGHIRALEGTRVEIIGTANEPLGRAVLQLDAGPKRQQIEARLTEDGRHFVIPAEGSGPWTIDTSGTYSLALAGRRGDRPTRGVGAGWEVQAVADSPPSISLARPPAKLFVTAGAVVPIEATVRDDLAIHVVRLRYSRSDRSGEGEKTIALYRGPDRVPPAGVGGLAPDGQRGQTLAIEDRFDLAKLEGLAAGASILVRVAASDYRPQEEQSTSRRLIVITPGQLSDRIAQRQTYILGQLAEMLKAERQSRSQTAELQIQLSRTGRLAKQHVDQLQSAELNQRRVGRLAADERDGVLTLIASLLEDLENNRVDNADVRRRMEQLFANIKSISREQLPAIQQALISALKGARAEMPPAAGDGAAAGEKMPPVVSDSLDEAGRHQDAVIARLEEILGGLSEWDNYRRFAREIRQLRRDQQDVSDQTGALGAKTRAKDIADLDEQEKADLAKLTRRQLELARQMDKIQSGMQRSRDALAGSDPLVSQTLADALDAAGRRAVGSRMRESGRNIGENRVGRAAQLQQEIDRGLAELLDVLANRRESELGRLVEKLREAAAELAELHREHQGLREKLEAAATISDPTQRRRELMQWVKEQAQLEERLQRVSRRLRRLQAERPADSVEKAAAEMGRTAEAAGQGDQAGALEQARAADTDLEQARQELDRVIEQAERDLAEQQLARLEQAIEGLASRQQAVLDETMRLDQIRIEKGLLDGAHLVRARQSARQQQDLAVETTDLARSVARAEVFQMAMEDVADRMRRAADRLRRGDTADATQQSERDSLAGLARLLDALKAEADDEQNDSGGGAASGGPGSPCEGGTRNLAELKLLKLMQEALNRQTTDLETARVRQGELTEEQQQQLATLARRQGRLAKLVFDLSEPAEENPEGRPERLPDPRGGGGSDEELERSLDDELLDDLNSDLDDHLLDGLGESRKGEDVHLGPQVDPLTRIGRRMTTAEEMIARQDTSPKTQELQEQIVADLAEMIDRIKKQKRSSAGAGKVAAPADKRPGLKQPDRRPGDGAQQPPAQGSGQKSTDRIGRTDGKPLDPREMDDLIKQIWGHLPDRLRDQMQSVSGRRFLPQYERLIEDYFKRLAEDRDVSP